MEWWIPILYATLSAAWIAFSDLLFSTSASSPEEQARWSILTEWGFLVVTAVLLYAGLRWAFVREHRALRSVESSETLLRTITDTIPDAVYLKDRQSRMLFANPATLRAIGKSAEAVLGKTAREYYDEPSVGEAIFETDRRILESGTAAVVEEIVRNSSGTRTYLSTKAPRRNAEGEIIGLIGCSRDITDRKQMEEEREQLVVFLRESATEANQNRAQLEAVFQAMSDGVMVFDVTGNAVLVNQAQATINGFSRPEVMKQNLTFFAQVYEFSTPDGTPLPVEQWPPNRVLRGESFVDYELHGRRRDTGREWLFSFSGEPVLDSLGKPILAIVVTRDITERKRTADKIASERERLMVTLRSIGDAVIATDEHSRVTVLNSVAEKLTGWTAEEAIGRPLQEVFNIINEETRRPAQNPVERVLREGITVGLANHSALIARDGTERPISESGAPILDSSGRISGVVLVFRDQTEERLAKATLLRSQRELFDLVEKFPIGVFVERGGKVLYANAMLAFYLGRSQPSDLVGAKVSDLLVPDEYRPEDDSSGQEAPLPPSPPDRLWRAIRHDGRIVTLESSATKEISYEGQPAVLWALRDLTDLKMMQAHLMQADRLASVGMLAAGVAHEINNPLAYLIAALDFLADQMAEVEKKLPASGLNEVVQALEEARTGAERVKHVVRDLRTFSRRHEERRSRIELEPILESSINMATNEIKYRARLVREYASAPAVFANEARLGQVFLNLLINAAQAIPEGQVDRNQIRVVTRTDERGRAVVEIHDTGTGIPPELMGRIFDPFVTTKPLGVGTGLGLSICRNIVNSLDGEITVESHMPGGTVARVTLPAAPAISESEISLPPPAVDPGRRGRILVVDDEPAIGGAIRRMLAPEHEVTVLTNALEARTRIAQGERYDVLFCDLMMPQMTGMDLHAEITRLAPDQAERMVLLTGGAFTESATSFLSHVQNPRLEKPFDPAGLRNLVRNLLS